MSKVFFIADTHFGSEPLRLCESRPFSDTREMDEQMILRLHRADRLSPH